MEETLTASVQRQLRAFLNDDASVQSALQDAEHPQAFAHQLLLAPAGDVGDAMAISTAQILRAFPSDAAYVDQLAVIFSTWSTTLRCPLLDMHPAIEGVSVVTDSYEHVTSVPLEVVHQFVHAGSTGTQSTATFVRQLGGARGLLTCLGYRETTGSRTVAPLTRAQCLASFQLLHSDREKLTVGARAFTKHCVRSSDSFWGEFKGNDLCKNATAMARVQQLMDEAVWKNIHSLPHSEATFELRNAQGYGARWYVADQSFRGFLEPPMAGGHENRWRH